MSRMATAHHAQAPAHSGASLRHRPSSFDRVGAKSAPTWEVAAEAHCLVTRMFRSSSSPRPVPIALEAVHAGFPSVAQDYFAGDFSFDEHIITHPDTTFIVTVSGDSMQGAGIWDGDLLIVDRSLDPQADDVVVAVLDDELTVKRLILRDNRPVLHPENPRYPDFMPSGMQDLVIWGVVTGNFHAQSARRRSNTAMTGVVRPHTNAQATNVGETYDARYQSLGWEQ